MCSKDILSAAVDIIVPKSPKIEAPKAEKDLPQTTAAGSSAAETQPGGVTLGDPAARRKRGVASLIIPLANLTTAAGGLNIPR